MALALVGSSHSAHARFAIRAIRERLVDITALVAVETTILPLSTHTKMSQVTHHRNRIAIRVRLRIPLHGHLARRARVRAVVSRTAGLVRTHGPAGVFGIGCDRDQARVRRELALAASLFDAHLGDGGMVFMSGVVVMVVSMASRCLDPGDNGEKRGGARGELFEAHVDY